MASSAPLKAPSCVTQRVLLIPYQLFTAHNCPTTLSEQPSIKSKVNQKAELMSFKQEEKRERY